MKRGSGVVRTGDCMAVLPALPAASFHCCVTSPPYFSLRSYLPTGHPDKAKEIGSEPSPEKFIETMVAVFREVRRVLHPSGTLWLNLGDSYNQYNHNRGCSTGALEGRRSVAQQSVGSGLPEVSCGPGQLLNMPHRVAEALRADGWVWRQTIVWAKLSPMPESVSGWRWTRCRIKVAKQSASNSAGQHYPSELNHPERNRNPDSSRNPELCAKWVACPGCPKCSPNGGWVLRLGKGRCTTAHEYVFVFGKNADYFWDSAAFVENSIHAGKRISLGDKSLSRGQANASCRAPSGNALAGSVTVTPNRNPRSVWVLSSEPTKEKHFAAYPSALVRRCLQAGTSDGGCCPECGAPWAPMVEASQRVATRPALAPKDDDNADAVGQRSGRAPNRNPHRHIKVGGGIVGYRPTCTCGAAESRPCRVLDPFAGTGTTIRTASWMGRNALGVELNPEYTEIALRLIDTPPRWYLKRENATGNRLAGRREPAASQKSLF